MRRDLMKKESRVNARLPAALKRCLEQFLAFNSHMNISEFIRDAIREKISREAPELYRRLFKGNQDESAKQN
jgi:metal-responsive CopG/Arc/MetJ family transcriptional regulator